MGKQTQSASFYEKIQESSYDAFSARFGRKYVFRGHAYDLSDLIYNNPRAAHGQTDMVEEIWASSGVSTRDCKAVPDGPGAYTSITLGGSLSSIHIEGEMQPADFMQIVRGEIKACVGALQTGVETVREEEVNHKLFTFSALPLFFDLGLVDRPEAIHDRLRDKYSHLVLLRYGLLLEVAYYKAIKCLLTLANAPVTDPRRIPQGGVAKYLEEFEFSSIPEDKMGPLLNFLNVKLDYHCSIIYATASLNEPAFEPIRRRELDNSMDDFFKLFSNTPLAPYQDPDAKPKSKPAKAKVPWSMPASRPIPNIVDPPALRDHTVVAACELNEWVLKFTPYNPNEPVYVTIDTRESDAGSVRSVDSVPFEAKSRYQPEPEPRKPKSRRSESHSRYKGRGYRSSDRFDHRTSISV